MVHELMMECNNYFVIDEYRDTYTIANGTVAAPFLTEGQYFRVQGSKYNDGVYQYPVIDLIDEEFYGVISACAVPVAFIALADKVAQYNTTFADVSPYSSESFGGYSYSKGSNSSGAPVTWREVFSRQLRKWRKV